MSTLAVVDGNGQLVYLDMEGGGTALDPFRPRQIDQPVVAGLVQTAQIQIATAGTVVQLPSYPLKSGVLVKALATNNGRVYIGGPGVTSSNGFELSKSESLWLRVADLGALYLTCSAANEGICLLGV
jgi:hypothetical protein